MLASVGWVPGDDRGPETVRQKQKNRQYSLEQPVFHVAQP
jgi:hypothetical protein